MSVPAPLDSRQRAAILFADVHGYSLMMSRDEKGTVERVGRAIRLIRSLVGDYGGRVVQTAGDAVLALFDTSPDALGFAVEIQREFRKEAVWHPEEKPIAFRIGINSGDVLIGEGGAHGHAINVAARIEELARPGGICISRAIHAAATDKSELRIRPLGHQTLKNIPEPVEVFAIETNGLQTAPPVPLPAIEAPPPSEASVAVLPLDNLSGDPSDIHLCDGITDDIITNLSRFRDLLVIARYSAFQFKGRNLPPAEVGRQLGVRYLASGGLHRSASKIGLSIQLVEAQSGAVLWADRFKRDLADIFAFQVDVSEMIAARLAVQIGQAERRRIVERNPPDPLAYGLVLRGHDLSLRYFREANLHARRLFEQAADIDPKFGRCYAGLSRTFNLAWRYRWTPSPEAALDKAVELARQAIAYDSLDARGYGELGFAELYKKCHDASLTAYERALELNPNDADILAEMGDALSYAGDHQRAIKLLRRAMRLNPFYPDWYLWYLGEAYFHLGEFEQTVQTLTKMRNQSEAHRLLASSYAHLSRTGEAHHHAQQVLAVHPDFSIEHWRTVPPYKDPRQVEVLIEGLRKAGLK